MLEVLTFTGISVVAGVVLGVVWFFAERCWERYSLYKTQEILMEGGEEEQVANDPPTTDQSTDKTSN